MRKFNFDFHIYVCVCFIVLFFFLGGYPEQIYNEVNVIAFISLLHYSDLGESEFELYFHLISILKYLASS